MKRGRRARRNRRLPPVGADTLFRRPATAARDRRDRATADWRSALALCALLALGGCANTIAPGEIQTSYLPSDRSPRLAAAIPVPEPRPLLAALAVGSGPAARQEIAAEAMPAAITAVTAATFVPTRAPRGLDSRLLAEGALLAIAADPPGGAVRVASLQGGVLPGVKLRDDLFGIDEGEHEDGDGVQLASVGGMARMSPNGLRLQTEKVDVHCFEPRLVALLRKVERHFGKPLTVTSGYRSPAINRRAGGARKSLHVQCMAADIQVEGVQKFALARFLRAMPERGGVGTYCRTESVHIDIGEARDWHYPCRRLKKRRISA